MLVQFNPMIQTNAAGSFGLEADGVITGTAWPDPAVRFALSGGIVHPDEVLPIWGGVAIEEYVAGFTFGQPRPELGGNIKRAVDDATLTGWAVFDQNYSMINSIYSPVPFSGPGGQVNFYRIGCGARIAVPIDPNNFAWDGSPINAGYAWDYTEQRLTSGGTLPVRVLRVFLTGSMAAVYDAANSSLGWDRNAAAAVILI